MQIERLRLFAASEAFQPIHRTIGRWTEQL